MRNSDAESYGGMGRPDRRGAQQAPQARVYPGRQRHYPALNPRSWYPLAEVPREAEYVRLQTAHGLMRVRRLDVEVRATAT